MATVQGVYVALFGRPADPLGLQFYNNATSNGANLQPILAQLGTSPEYTARFTGQSNVQIVNAIYQDLFNRDADVAGLTFYVNALNTGTLNIGQIAVAILDGATGNDASIITNKLAAANLFTARLDTGAEIVAYNASAIPAAQAFLDGVNANASSVPTQAQVDAAISAIVNNAGTGGGVTGLTFNLTAGADIFGPNSATAALKTTANDDTFRALESGQLTSADVIDGGAGTDTLRANVTATGGNAAGTTVGANSNVTINPVLTSVENVFLNASANGGLVDGATAGGNASVTFNAGSSTGIRQLWSEGTTLTANGGTVAAPTFSGVNLTTTVGLKDTAAGLTVNFASATGAADSATIALADASGNATVTVGNIETLNVNSTTGSVGAVTVNTTTFAAAQAETVNITGNQAASLTFSAANNAALKTVDASTFTNALTLAVETGPAEVTIRGGAGADTYNITDSSDDKVTIDLGAGADTLNIRSFDSHQITTGAGADTINISFASATTHKAIDVSTAATLASSAIVVTDFTSGSDVLNVRSAVGGAAEITFSGTQLANIAGQSNLLNAATTAFTEAAVAHGAALQSGDGFAFQFGGNTYAIVNGATGGGVATLSTDDLIVQLTGVTALAAADFTVA